MSKVDTEMILVQAKVIDARVRDLSELQRKLKMPGSLHALWLCRISDAVTHIRNAAKSGE